MSVIHFRTSRLRVERAKHPAMRRRCAASFLPKSVLWMGAGSICLLLAIGCSGGDEFRGAPAPRRVGSVNVEANVTSLECPIITSYTVSPFEKAAGNDVALTSTTSASFGVKPKILWSATSGTFNNADDANTTYRCGAQLNPIITLTVSYGTCLDSVQIDQMDCS